MVHQTGSRVSLDDLFGALADEHRREVVRLLRKGPRRAGALAEALRLPAPAMSKHLRVLRESGLIEQFDEADARAKVYRLKPERFGDLREWLDDVERFWSAQLGAFAKYAEKKRKK